MVLKAISTILCDLTYLDFSDFFRVLFLGRYFPILLFSKLI